MEIVAAEDVGVGVDLFPPLPPLAFSLYDSLPAVSFPPPDIDLSPLLPSDIRAALRLLESVSLSAASLPHRLGGLLTNHHLLMADSSISLAIKRAATLMDRRNTELVVVEAAICAVLTNAVEVQDSTGLALGIAVYDPHFSWINHSCSPNACYRFLQEHVALCSISQGYGPKVIVRSIKRIKSGEEITVSYIDILQPTGFRHSDLWSRYRFMCCCVRCAASPPAYVDAVLEGVSALEPAKAHHGTTYKDDEAVGKMTGHIKEAIDDFLSDNINPETCCDKIESVLHHGIHIKASSQPHHLFLLPSHHVALHAYITLATAYRIRSSFSETSRAMDGKAFDMSRISAAYSLFLAAASHHLFSQEPSLVISAAAFWTRAGEYLLDLARNFLMEPSGEFDVKCTKCDMLETPNSHRDIKENSRQLLRCITNISQVTWSFLARGCPYLKKFRSPFDFSVTGSNGEREASSEDLKGSVLLLSFHCLLYADLLTDLCYGRKSNLVSQFIV